MFSHPKTSWLSRKKRSPNKIVRVDPGSNGKTRIPPGSPMDRFVYTKSYCCTQQSNIVFEILGNLSTFVIPIYPLACKIGRASVLNRICVSVKLKWNSEKVDIIRPQQFNYIIIISNFDINNVMSITKIKKNNNIIIL